MAPTFTVALIQMNPKASPPLPFPPSPNLPHPKTHQAYATQK
jgi:predicted amidohydrolase